LSFLRRAETIRKETFAQFAQKEKARSYLHVKDLTAEGLTVIDALMQFLADERVKEYAQNVLIGFVQVLAAAEEGNQDVIDKLLKLATHTDAGTRADGTLRRLRSHLVKALGQVALPGDQTVTAELQKLLMFPEVSAECTTRVQILVFHDDPDPFERGRRHMVPFEEEVKSLFKVAAGDILIQAQAQSCQTCITGLVDTFQQESWRERYKIAIILSTFAKNLAPLKPVIEGYDANDVTHVISCLEKLATLATEPEALARQQAAVKALGALAVSWSLPEDERAKEAAQNALSTLVQALGSAEEGNQDVVDTLLELAKHTEPDTLGRLRSQFVKALGQVALPGDHIVTAELKKLVIDISSRLYLGKSVQIYSARAHARARARALVQDFQEDKPGHARRRGSRQGLQRKTLKSLHVKESCSTRLPD
jgi:hypothetical protein